MTFQRMSLSFGLKVTACLVWALSLQAATLEVLWVKKGEEPSFLSQFGVLNENAPPTLRLPQNTVNHAKNTLRFVQGRVDDNQISHVRYDQYFLGVPVWGAQLIYHLGNNSITLTGQVIAHIEEDIKTLDTKLSAEDAKQIAFSKIPGNKEPVIKKIVYLKSKSSKAVLAYLISYWAETQEGRSFPHFIINANTGKTLRFWNGHEKAEIGQGQGGVTFSNLSYRPGRYQFGTYFAGLNALGKLNVVYRTGTCTINNPLFQVVSLENQAQPNLPFTLPISYANAQKYQLLPFSYACSSPNYLNLNDGGFAPVNDGLSPINDVTYFIQQTFDMYRVQYGSSAPIGSNLPIRVYVHLDDFDNAEACSTSCMRESGVAGPQQLTFGNGSSENAPYSDIGTSGHEFAHLVTGYFSNLIYENQSGGINESFSDMGEFALKSYLRKRYPWIWNGKDWTIGLDISKIKKASRYMNNPPLDGHSIGNAANFVRGMDVHYSSGVFNKAFYLLSTTPGWTVEKAFRIMFDANMHYWIPASTFDYAACGVIQAAYNRGYPHQDVINAFSRVGVTCLVGEAPLMA
ncbi:M4 family metallopeptidase [Legionella hackeliae]|uniref:Neutral metalloproteinase n=1 Tax=Legionella hackeliae TaxID=449 RepID=A0A0A8UNU9_LEGHA|nr:M4 family metallopeptidase [Legionella hackeliae]KTD13740.1 virulence metalloprotease [Legionella hackeliae]CEK10438.1 Vibriolysin [Legionella hackeliae]STX47174.1 virulence metalloprotease [Legionella hackeliae]